MSSKRGKTKDIIYYQHFLMISLFINYCNILQMASLASSFIQATSPVKCFFSLLPPIPSYPQQPTTTDNKLQQIQQPISLNKFSDKLITFPYLINFKNLSDKMINRFIKFHINNFSQLYDHSSHDFKDCNDLVHVLQITQQNDDQFKISEIDTVQSISISADCSTRDEAFKSNTVIGNGDVNNIKNHLDIDDFSDVQDAN